MDTLVEIEDLRIQFTGEREDARVVNGVSFCIEEGEVLGMVGESGSGKTMTSLAMLDLLPGGSRVTGGSVWLEGEDIFGSPPDRVRRIRGGTVAMIFQEPSTALNPVMSVGDQIIECIRVHTPATRTDSRRRAIELLGEVGIPEPGQRFKSYPHQLSGGMRQRVMIAMALAGRPKLLIADEPTTALDVTVQAQILDLLRDLQREYNLAILLVTHDLGVVTEIADRVLIMYAGRIVEQGAAEEIFREARHPYTLGMLRSIPSVNNPGSRLSSLQGDIPDPAHLPSGCTFHPRCSLNDGNRCEQKEPGLQSHGASDSHMIRCHYADQSRKLLLTETVE